MDPAADIVCAFFCFRWKMNMLSISVAVWYVIRVGKWILGRNEFDMKLSRNLSVG